MVAGGWLEKVLMYSGVLLAFQKGKHFLFSFFTHADILSKRRDFLELWIILIKSH